MKRKTHRRCSWAALSIVLCAAAGCMTAQQARLKRIERDADTFARFPTNIQARVMAGAVDVGFTTEMARLAWGWPDRVLRRRTGDGESTIWIYSRRDVAFDSDLVTVPVYTRDRQGRARLHYESQWVDVRRHHEVPVARVVFVDGRIVEIEAVEDGAP